MNSKIYLIGFALLVASSSYALDSIKRPSNSKPVVKYFEYDASNAFFSSSSLTPAEDLMVAEMTKKDASWKEGNLFLYDEKRFFESQPIQSNAEDKYSKPTTIKLPHHKKALEMFSRSVDISKNPVSAYQGMHILKAYLGTETPENIALFTKFAKTLYEKKNCEGYLEYGNIFENQKFKLNDYDKAISVYNEGLLKCNNIRPYSFLLGTRIEAVKIKKNKK